MRTPILTLSVLLAAAVAPVHAEVWTDPDMADAVAGAELIVLARAPARGSSGKPRVRFSVERTLKGEAPPSVVVGGLHDPTTGPGPVFRPGEQVYLLLRKHEGLWQVPTPTCGRFPLRDGRVLFATLRDTYLRLTLFPGDFEAFVALLLGKRDSDWLQGLRAHLHATGPTNAEAPVRARQYVALEALARAGGPSDRTLIRRYLVEDAPFQLRISACRALAKVGPRAIEDLESTITTDREPAVRTAAIRALCRIRPAPRDLVRRLADLLPGAPIEPVRFAGPNDPRLNKWPSPKVALLNGIGEAGPRAARADLLAVLDRREVRPDVFSAALKALLRLQGDDLLAHELIERFRDDDSVGADLLNRELCAALTRLTGQPFGADVSAWQRWSRKD